MCISSKQRDSDTLLRPIITENLDSSLWNNKCDYVEIKECHNLNPNNYNLTVIQLNVRSLLSNQTELNQLLIKLENQNSRVDIVLLCETFLSDHTFRFVKKYPVTGYMRATALLTKAEELQFLHEMKS